MTLPEPLKKMIYSNLAKWMKENKITEIKLSFTDEGKEIIENAIFPARFIHTDEIDKQLEQYKAEFGRLRKINAQLEVEIENLKNPAQPFNTRENK